MIIPPVHGDDADNVVFDHVFRETDVDTFGIVTVKDRFSLTNNGTNPISSVTVFYPKAYLPTLEVRTAHSAEEALLSFTVDESASSHNYVAYVVSLQEIIVSGESYEFYIFSEFYLFHHKVYLQN